MTQPLADRKGKKPKGVKAIQKQNFGGEITQDTSFFFLFFLLLSFFSLVGILRLERHVC